MLLPIQSPALKSPYVKIASEQGPPQEMYMPTLGQPATPGWHADPHATIGIGVSLEACLGGFPFQFVDLPFQPAHFLPGPFGICPQLLLFTLTLLLLAFPFILQSRQLVLLGHEAQRKCIGLVLLLLQLSKDLGRDVDLHIHAFIDHSPGHDAHGPGPKLQRLHALIQWDTLEQSVCAPVSFTKLQKVQAVLHTLHLSLMHPSHKYPCVTLPDLEVFVLRPQQVLCGKAPTMRQSKCVNTATGKQAADGS
ncbi:MAG: hypothetical protein FRX49_09544 [Trebouxia sp. A1-2]|nr:MAG: hypothetical protein FRX49_09544 [Trebouxia sp. A1-2]